VRSIHPIYTGVDNSVHGSWIPNGSSGFKSEMKMVGQGVCIVEWKSEREGQIGIICLIRLLYSIVSALDL
jgi:hypothetical protein